MTRTGLLCRFPRLIGVSLTACLLAPICFASPPRKKTAKRKPAAHAPASAKKASPPAPLLPSSPSTEVVTPSTMPVSDYLEVGRWRGDGNGADDTGQNNGSPTDGVGYARAMVGRGFHFTGRDDAVIVRDSPSLAPPHSFTINAWIKVETFPTADEYQSMVLFRGDDRGGLDPYTIHVKPDHRLYFHIESEKGNTEVSAPVDGQSFVMVTAVFDDSSGKMDLYENLVLLARTLTPIRPLAGLDPAQHAAIGIGNCNALPGSVYRFPFHGIINDLRIWQRVLAPGELESLYSGYSGTPAKESRGDAAK